MAVTNKKFLIIKLTGILLVSFINISLIGQADFKVLEQSPGNYILKISSSSLTNDPPEKQLEVFIDSKKQSITNPPPIFGEYRMENKEILFFPLVKFKAGQSYKAIFHFKDEFHFTIPENTEVEAPNLIGIYPSSDQIPENILKFYLYFDQPMAEGQAYSKVQLFKKDGSLVIKPFLELEPELWNADQTRLTLWLDPGRVKRDLIPNQKMGPPLSTDQEYILKISADWQNTAGLTIGNETTKIFKTYAADRQVPSLKNWKINPPKVKSSEPLSLHFPEPMDFALLQNSISILLNGEEVEGTITTENNEKSWLFNPKKPWEKGEYQIEVLARLEDLAANNLNRPFDRELNTKSQKEQEFYIIPFSIQ